MKTGTKKEHEIFDLLLKLDNCDDRSYFFELVYFDFDLSQTCFAIDKSQFQSLKNQILKILNKKRICFSLTESNQIWTIVINDLDV